MNRLRERPDLDADRASLELAPHVAGLRRRHRQRRLKHSNAKLPSEE